MRLVLVTSAHAVRARRYGVTDHFTAKCSPQDDECHAIATVIERRLGAFESKAHTYVLSH